jgi:hypothetical protein
MTASCFSCTHKEPHLSITYYTKKDAKNQYGETIFFNNFYEKFCVAPGKQGAGEKRPPENGTNREKSQLPRYIYKLPFVDKTS